MSTASTIYPANTRRRLISLQHAPRGNSQDTAIVTPNSDTPYSLGFMDLRAEPVVISVPAIDKSRYYSVQLCDGNTFNYGYIGTRTTGPEAGDLMVAGPDWKGEMPAGNQEGVLSSTQFSISELPHPALQPGPYAERNQNQTVTKCNRSQPFRSSRSACGTHD